LVIERLMRQQQRSWYDIDAVAPDATPADA
jgi:hypothetical protein